MNLQEHWNLSYEAVPVYHRVWSVGESHILKHYHNEEELKRNIAMFRNLLAQGIPVPEVVALPDGRDYLEYEGDFYLLTIGLPGESMTNKDAIPEDFFHGFGGVLARLHLAFLECQKHLLVPLDYWENNMSEEMEGWVWNNLEQHRPEGIDLEQAQADIKELCRLLPGLPRQLIHRDVHLGNFLFDQGRFSGYIDFDLSQVNVRIFDLCYFLLGLRTGSAYHIQGEDAWMRAVKEVFAGYHEVNPLIREERLAAVSVMKNIELLFAAYFAGEGQTEFMKKAVELYGFVGRNEAEILRNIQ